MSVKKERSSNINAVELSDQQILDMLARIFGVGDQEELATAYSTR